MSLNPDTLVEEADWEKRERQRQTGVLGTGIAVVCRPDPEDPAIMQTQHRAVCLVRPYRGCAVCPHQTFTLVFKSNPPDPYQLISCPRWRNEGERLHGNPPVSYVPVERALCSERPFAFCSSCPPQDELVDFGADKVRPGWYSRWRRILTSIQEEEEKHRG